LKNRAGYNSEIEKTLRKNNFIKPENLTFLINPIYLKGCFRNGFAIKKAADLMKKFEKMVKVS
jgi:hypothetical protein